MILSIQELIELTGKQRRRAQARVLDALGIPYRLRPDGSLVVFYESLPHAAAQNKQASPALRLPTR